MFKKFLKNKTVTYVERMKFKRDNVTTISNLIREYK